MFDKLFSRLKLFGRGKKESETAQVIVTATGGGGTVWPAKRYDVYAKETYLKNIIAFRCIDEIAKSVASVQWKVFERQEDGVEIINDHPMMRILARPNPEESFGFIILKAIAYLVMSGNAFFERVVLETGPNRGEIREFYSLRPDRFQMITDSAAGKLIGYKYSVGGKPVNWEIDPITGQCNILHLKSFHPLDDWWGGSATEPASREIDTSNEATEWNKKLLENEGRPGMIYTLVGNIGDVQAERLERMLADRAGSAHAGKNLILTGEKGTKAEPYGWSLKDMDFIQGSRELARRIAYAYGVPPQLIGIPGDTTFANYKEARLHFWEGTIFYYLNYLRGELSNWCFRKEGEEQFFLNYVLDDVPALALRRELIWKRAQESDFLKINEKREMVGREPIDGGDIILVSASMIPLGAEEEGSSIEEEEEEEAQTRQDLLDQGYSPPEVEQMLGWNDYSEEIDEGTAPTT